MAPKQELTKIQQNFINKSKKDTENGSKVHSCESQTIYPYAITDCDIDSQSSIIKKVKIEDITKTWSGKLKFFRKYQTTPASKYFLLKYKGLEWISSFDLVIGFSVCFLTILSSIISPISITLNMFIFGVITGIIGLTTLMILIIDRPYISIISFCGSVLFVDGFGLLICHLTILTYEENTLKSYSHIFLIWLIIFLILLIQLFCVTYCTIQSIPMKEFLEMLTKQEERLKKLEVSRESYYKTNNLSKNIPIKYMV